MLRACPALEGFCRLFLCGCGKFIVVTHAKVAVIIVLKITLFWAVTPFCLVDITDVSQKPASIIKIFI
jgi:hypothetical protein